jgi:glycosyltransferase involved in cell wall biosynthesis
VNANYVLISPCRDEAQYMRETLESVVGQTVRPSKWIIVDDGSTDGTSEILAEYTGRFDWITSISRKDRGRREVGPGVVDAFYEGYNAIDISECEYLCKLDLDLKLPPRYFEILAARMAGNPRIGTCSGKAYIYERGQLVPEGHGDETSLGMSKFYRMTAFVDIGGFERQVMWDGIDCHRCRMNGWIACSWDEPELRFVHLRPEGTSQRSVYAGRMRHGYGQYYMGTGFGYVVASAIKHLGQRPILLGSMAMLWGWIWSFVLRKPRYPDIKFRTFLRRYQRRALLVGKRRAIEEIHRSAGIG